MNNRTCNIGELWSILLFVLLTAFVFNLGCDSPVTYESFNESLTQKIPQGWTRIDQLTGGRVKTIFAHDSDIYLGREATGISFSDDGGINWRSINKGLDSDGPESLWRKSITAFSRVGADIFSGVKTTGWISGDERLVGGVFMLSNPGECWKRIGLKEKQVSSLTVINNNLFAGTDSGVFSLKRDDNTWVEENIGLSDREITSLAVIDNYIFAGSRNNIYRTSDEGITWTSADKGLPQYSCINTLFAVGKMLFAASCEGMFLSEDHGANWIEKNDGLPKTDVGLPNIISMVQAASVLLTSAGLRCVQFEPSGIGCTKTGLLLANLPDIRWEFIEFEGIEPVSLGITKGEIFLGISKNGRYASETHEVWRNLSILSDQHL